MQNTPLYSNQSDNASELNGAPPDTISNDTIFCSRCGEKNPENNYKCSHCGFVLHDSPAPQVIVSNEDTLTSLIPIKNKQALISYYLGVFSLLPILGIPLGIAAFILGIRGVKFAKIHPEAKGAIHAWVGLILGGFFGLCNILLIVIPMYFALHG